MKIQVILELNINQEPHESKEQIVNFIKTWIEDAYDNGEMTGGLDSSVEKFRAKVT
jgi:hypothetical protein